MIPMSLEKERQAAQLAFLASGQQIELGDRSTLPLSIDALVSTNANSPYVIETFASGLTAHVYRIRAAGRDWTLKCKRSESLVKNVDGQTSFLNEVQRRRDFAELKADQRTASRFTHIVDTEYASLCDGIILSPWADGERLQHFDRRVFDQLFATIVDLELHGLFEWDFCPGNIVDDGSRLMLFDFGYMYRFEPRDHYNNNGLATPLFHGIERFETRNFFDFLLRNPGELDDNALMALFHEEKQVALKHYQHKLDRLHELQAVAPVLAWQRAINQRWERALGSSAALQELYLVEGFRSNVLDLFDDLHGKSCTPLTLRKADVAVSLLQRHFTLLKEQDGLFFGDEHKTRPELIKKYQQLKQEAAGYQLA